MIDTATILAGAVPIAGWVIYVERRLATIAAIKDKVDETSNQVDRLVDHLIGAPK